MRIALLVTGLVAVLVTWPLALDPAGSLVGHPGNDVWNHVWGYWWFADSITHGQLPFVTDLQHFPHPGRLFFIDSFGALISLPLQLIGGPAVAMNLTVIANFWAAGMAAWALARHVRAELLGPDRADRDALVAAVAYATAPHLLGQAYDGITETLFAWGFPLAILAVLRLLARPGWRTALVAGGAMALNTLANWYYGLFAVVGSAVLLVAFALWRRERTAWTRLPVALGLSAVLAGAAVSPVLLGFSSSLEGEDALVRRDPEFVWRSLVDHNVTDLVSLFHPGKFYSPDLEALHGEKLVILTYLGWVLLGLAGLGFMRLRRWRDRGPWLLFILTFFVLALGPYLYVDGGYLTVDDRRIPLPFLALFEVVPLFGRISHPFRFVMGGMLGLGIFASLGVGRLPRLAQPLVMGLVVAEALLASPAIWPLPRSDARLPAYVAVLAADPTPGAVLDLPISLPNLERAVYGYWQTGHRRPSPYMLNEPLPLVLDRSHLARTLLVSEASRVATVPPTLPELDLVVSARNLGRLGVRWVVVHGNLYPPDRLGTTLTILRTALGPETTTTDDGAVLWQLPVPEPEG